MYKLLKRMHDTYANDQWLKLVEQAHDRGKITDDQYAEFTSEAYAG